jgi:hypothetical protein
LNDNQVIEIFNKKTIDFYLLDLSTIDNLFHMADDINRAVGDLVSVIIGPQSSTYYQQVVN